MKKIFFGIIIGILIATAIPVAAEQVNKKVTATVRADFSLQIDGSSFKLESHPLAFDGKSYLPVAEVAKALGKEVAFKDGVIKLDTPIEASNEVTITSKEDFNKEISKREGVIAENERYLQSTIEVYEELQKRTETKEDELAVLIERKGRYETEIVENKKAIADLKAKYPQYAN